MNILKMWVLKVASTRTALYHLQSRNDDEQVKYVVRFSFPSRLWCVLTRRHCLVKWCCLREQCTEEPSLAHGSAPTSYHVVSSLHLRATCHSTKMYLINLKYTQFIIKGKVLFENNNLQLIIRGITEFRT